jgi:hypothetical protein
MYRTLGLSRRATRLLALVPFAVMTAAAACGGYDTIPSVEDGGADAASGDGASPVDGETLDGTSPDGTIADTGADGAMVDGSVVDGTVIDGEAHDGGHDADAAELEDGSHPQDASDASDGEEPHDAKVDEGTGDATTDAEDASDAGDMNDSEAGDASADLGVLGSGIYFAVFSGDIITNATATVTTITGDVGTYPSSTALAGTPPVVVGNTYLGDLVAMTAAADLQSAYGKLTPGNLACSTNLTGTDLGGLTLTPGVYCFASGAGLTGKLTLNAQNNPDAVWVIQVGSALTTASDSSVVVVNGTPGQACNAYWQISSSATLGTKSIFGGTILAMDSVTVTTGTAVLGRVFGLTAEVSTDTNVISNASCAVGVSILDAGLPMDADVLDAADAAD